VSRDQTLREGVQILDAAMRPSGFRFEQIHDGHYACGRYVKGARVLELHFSDSLRLVSQRIDDLVVMHDDYMRAKLGPKGGRYPSASADPLDSFRALRIDLELHCADFLEGAGHEWRELAERALRDPRRFTITHEFLKLEDTRRDARSAFASHEFGKCVSLYSAIEKLLMPAEVRRLEIARRRVARGGLDGW
jgi:hypothetical protein